MDFLYYILGLATTGLFTAIILTVFSRIGLFPLIILGTYKTDDKEK